MAEDPRLSDLPPLPRDEGGPVFAEPWQAQAFAMAVTLSERGYFTWPEWAAALAAELKAAADSGHPDDGSAYYQHWLTTLERLVAARQLASPAELVQRKDEWADAYRNTPHGRPVSLRGPGGLKPERLSTLPRVAVTRPDGSVVDLLRRRAHVSYCFSGCCCGKTERGYAPVPATAFKDEWIRRRLRKVVHLTKAACLGPCELANVANVLFDGRATWFHSVDDADEVRRIFDYVESMLDADRYLPPPEDLERLAFNYYDWDARATAGPGEEPR